MSDDIKPINITILDKEYLVSCRDKERDALYSTVRFLNSRLEQVRDNGKIIGGERIAIMTALNIAHEYLEYKNQRETHNFVLDAGLQRMHNKIAEALIRGQQQQPEPN